jgi:hypothetical protein
MDNTKNYCVLDLTMSYGRFGGNRLIEVLNAKEEKLCRRLERDEILEAYQQIDNELFPMLMSRKGK